MNLPLTGNTLRTRWKKILELGSIVGKLSLMGLRMEKSGMTQPGNARNVNRWNGTALLMMRTDLPIGKNPGAKS